MNKKVNFGFTLFEILIVLAIIFTLSTLSINILFNNDDLLIRFEIERLYTLSLALQKKAQIEQKTFKISFDNTNQSYCTNFNNYKLDSNTKFGITSSAYGPPSNPKSKITKPITFKDNTIFFYSDGTISSGIIYITDKNEKKLYALSVGVSAISYLRRYKFKDKWILIR